MRHWYQTLFNWAQQAVGAAVLLSVAPADIEGFGARVVGVCVSRLSRGCRDVYKLFSRDPLQCCTSPGRRIRGGGGSPRPSVSLTTDHCQRVYRDNCCTTFGKQWLQGHDGKWAQGDWTNSGKESRLEGGR